MTTLGGFIALLVLMFFSGLSFWDNGSRDKLMRSVLFMITSGVAFAVSFYIPDIVTNGSTTGLSIGVALGMLGYSFLCAGLALRLMFWRAE